MFNLIDYKGKFTIIMDKGREDDLDYIVGEISLEDAIKECPERIGDAMYYGVPAYLGDNEELRRIYK